MSQKRLAEIVQVDVSTIQDIENGESNPTSNNLYKIMLELEMDFFPSFTAVLKLK